LEPRRRFFLSHAGESVSDSVRAAPAANLNLSPWCGCLKQTSGLVWFIPKTDGEGPLLLSFAPFD
jgi:hypothetical protein